MTLVHEFHISYSHTEWNYSLRPAKAAVRSGSRVLVDELNFMQTDFVHRGVEVESVDVGMWAGKLGN